jgi:hypothetical protein
MKKFFFTAVALLLIASPAWGVISFDATNSITDDLAATLNYSLTVGGGCTDPIIVVDVAWSSAVTVTALTIGGVSATLIGSAFLVDVGDRWISSYRRVGVSTGANAIAITFSGTFNTVQSAARSYCGVHQTTPTGTAAQAAGDSAGPATATVSSATGELVISTAHARNETFTTFGSTQTSRYNLDNAFAISGTDKAGTGSVQMDHNFTATTQWGIVAVALKPSGAVPPAARRRVVVVQ